MLAPNFASNPTWTDTVTNELRSLWESGSSAAQCSKAIYAKYGSYFSRAAVIGKLNRMGLLGKKNKTKAAAKRRGSQTNQLQRVLARKVRERKPRQVKPKAEAKKVTRLILSGHGRKQATLHPGIELTLPPERQPSPEAMDYRRTLLQLNNEHCRWPFGDPGSPDFFFCGVPGADVIGHRPYCPIHTRIARGKPRSVAA